MTEKTLIVFGTVFTILYVLIVFITLNLNPVNWHWGVRLVAVAIPLIVTVLYIFNPDVSGVKDYTDDIEEEIMISERDALKKLKNYGK